MTFHSAVACLILYAAALFLFTHSVGCSRSSSVKRTIYFFTHWPISRSTRASLTIEAIKLK